jgi:hypothetical protein
MPGKGGVQRPRYTTNLALVVVALRPTYNVALEVFDRPETFDPTIDPLVRGLSPKSILAIEDCPIARPRPPSGGKEPDVLTQCNTLIGSRS